jgi:hypothetical protein
MKIQRDIYGPLTYVERLGFNADLATRARQLVRVTTEKTKPNGDRLREYRESGLPSAGLARAFSPAPVSSNGDYYPPTQLAQMKEAMGADNPIVKKRLERKDSAEAAKDYIDNTKLDDIAVRKQL